MAVPVFLINGVNYTQYLKQRGLQWTRENTNAEGAGRDVSETMHPMVTSHQRTLEVTMGPMDFSVAAQLEAQLEAGNNGIRVTYPDLKDGLRTTRLFYNTSIESSMLRFEDGNVVLDNVKFTLVSIKEATVQ